MTIRIDQLNSTVNPERDHEFAAMRDGITVKLRAEQVLAVGDASDPQALKDFSNVDPETGRDALNLDSRYLRQGENLDDLDDAPTARSNLGLGTASVADVVGTVSQSGGVPTGAIIESDSNNDGEYTRFADGTQMCWENLNTSSNDPTTWTFPVAFQDQPVVVVCGQSINPRFGSAEEPSTTSVDFSSWNAETGNRAGVRCMLHAAGRWF